MEEDKKIEELPCGHFVCSTCLQKNSEFEPANLCQKSHKDDKMDFMNELKISDYSDNFDLKEFKCPIH